MNDLTRAIMHLKRAAFLIEQIRDKADPKLAGGLAKLVIGRALCCAGQAHDLASRYRDMLPTSAGDEAPPAEQSEPPAPTQSTGQEIHL